MRNPKQSKWLKVFCPEGLCLHEEERIDIPWENQAEHEDAWLATFCPDKTCEITSSSQLA